ncbi:MAG TPA: DUF2905 domain-containing protein [Terracidiphilus sp.]|jgi:hypothetical protein|nr:DUF2905 domain-containing protein [Terracidiphilus sp.]
MAELGKALLALGILLAVLGGTLLLASSLGLPLGRLPGDFAWKGKHVRIYIPLGTSILVSIVLTVLLYLLSRMRR